ncbi:MAG: hypothetical protein ACQEQ4_02465 [Fibrobacterota bacterium]
MKYSVYLCLIFSCTVAAVYGDVSFSGGIQYRFRGDIDYDTDPGGTIDPLESNFYHRYAWRAGIQNAVTENLSFTFALSNPSGFANTDKISSNAPHENGAVKIQHANFSYTNRGIGFSAGLIELKNNSALDIAWIMDYGDYSNTVNMSVGWLTQMDNSQAGGKVTLQPSEKIGLILAAAVKNDAGRYIDDEEEHYDGYRISFASPVQISRDLHLTPAGVLSTDMGPGNTAGTSFSGGLDLTVELSPSFSVSTGAGLGGYSLDNEEPLVFLGRLIPSFKFSSKGTFRSGYSFGIGRERLSEENSYYHHVDLNYIHKVTREIAVRPRLRGYYTTTNADDSIHRRIRPELILIARF